MSRKRGPGFESRPPLFFGLGVWMSFEFSCNRHFSLLQTTKAHCCVVYTLHVDWKVVRTNPLYLVKACFLQQSSEKFLIKKGFMLVFRIILPSQDITQKI